MESSITVVAQADQYWMKLLCEGDQGNEKNFLHGIEDVVDLEFLQWKQRANVVVRERLKEQLSCPGDNPSILQWFYCCTCRAYA